MLVNGVGKQFEHKRIIHLSLEFMVRNGAGMVKFDESLQR
jgi:hypothetical protein